MPNNSGRLIAIGDVHGCALALDAILEAIDPKPEDRLVFLGDLIDQGRESRDVLNRVIELKSRCHVAVIQGNHEEMIRAARDSEEALRFWERCGGATTINSYRFGGTLADIPPEHWALLEECLPFLETEDYIFTHANCLADVEMSEQPGYQLRWALLERDKFRPHFSGRNVVLGHTEQRDGEVLDLGFAKCIDTSCWRYGWLTAIDVQTGQVWQASRWGVLREEGDRDQSAELKEAFARVSGTDDDANSTTTTHDAANVSPGS